MIGVLFSFLAYLSRTVLLQTCIEYASPVRSVTDVYFN